MIGFVILKTIWTNCLFRVLNPHQWTSAKQNVSKYRIYIKDTFLQNTIFNIGIKYLIESNDYQNSNNREGFLRARSNDKMTLHRFKWIDTKMLFKLS